MSDQKNVSSTSQTFLDIHDITNDVVILKNGSASVILTVNAMNFGLLAEQEQDTVIYSYAGLLNSINYPIQILIQSQTKDASAYLKLLEKKETETKDKLKQAWIRRYSKFVSDLIRERNVLDKKFFVVIPASSLEMGLTPGQDLISGFKEQTIEGVEKSVILEKAKNLLDPKRDHLIAQFNRIGLYARQLSTQEIIRLFYTNYNPEATEGQQITNSENYTTALVQAQIRGDYMDNQSPNPLQPTTANPVDESATPAATPAATPVVGEVNISESPVLQKPASVAETPMPMPSKPDETAAPMTPMAPMSPSVDAATTKPVEITQPEATPAPTPTPVATMPTPTATMPKPTETASVDSTQENINSTLNQMTDKPTQ